MFYLAALHHFEIRYTSILDFPTAVREVLAPFVKEATNMRIENENMLRAKYTLLYEEADPYHIIVTWDRIILRYQGFIDNLIQSNSIIEQSYFNIFNRITALGSFGKAVEVAMQTTFLDIHAKLENLVQEFKKSYFACEKIDEILRDPTDYSVVLESRKETSQTTVKFGPYLGGLDLQKANIIAQQQDIIDSLEKVGFMAEVRMAEIISQIPGFSKYKEFHSASKSIVNNLWNLK